MNLTKILYVEDDLVSAKIVSRYLEKKGVLVSHVSNGSNIRYHILRENPDCLLLDIFLPGPSGYDLVLLVKEFYQGPIIFLSNSKSEKAEIHSFDLGIDEFIGKNESLELLYARIKRFFSEPKSKREVVDDLWVVRLGGLTVDKKSYTCMWGRKSINLTKDEIKTLYYFMSNAGRVISREELYIALTGVAYDGLSRGIDIKVSRIRDKISKVGINKDVLVSFRGEGYKFDKVSLVNDGSWLSMEERTYLNEVIN